MRRTALRRSREGFTLLELLVVILVIGVLLALLLPAQHYSGGTSRRNYCQNKLKILGIASWNYHDMLGHFPAAMGGTGSSDQPEQGNANRLSGLVALLPYLEEQALWLEISNPSMYGGGDNPPMGPAPWIASYEPWQRRVKAFECPEASAHTVVRANYTFCIGDMAQQIHQPTELRGMFAPGLTCRLDEILDGTSNTIAMGEIGTAFGRKVTGQFAIQQQAELLQNPRLALPLIAKNRSHPGIYKKEIPLSSLGRGGRWADGAAGYSLFNTILPPNSPSAAIGSEDAVDGLYSAASEHPGGCHLFMADGSVRFITADIDTGDLTRSTLSPEQMKAKTPSPYGVWGALGTIAGGEEISGAY